MNGNYLLLMAGKGSRFSSLSSDLPKPLLKIGNKRMFEVASDSIIKNFVNVKKIYLCCNQEVIKNLSKTKKIFRKINVVKSNSPIQTVLKTTKYSNFNKSLPMVIFDCDQNFDLYNKINLNNIFNEQINSFIFFKKTKSKNYGKIIKNKNNYLLSSFNRNSDLNCGIVGVYGFKKLSLFLKINKILSKQNFNREIVMPDIMKVLVQYNKLLKKNTLCIRVKRHSSFGNPASFKKNTKEI